MQSFQTKLIVLILGCVLISSLVIGSTGILSAQRVTDESSTHIMNLLCSEKAQSINALLSHIEQTVNTLAVYSSSQLENVEQMRTNDIYMDSYTKQIKDVSVNAAINTEGVQAVYFRFNPVFTSPTSGFFCSKTSLDDTLQDLPPTDLSKYSSEDIEHVGWYYLPVRSGKAMWVMPYLNQNVDIEMISFVIPIYKDNVTIGVIGMDIDFSILKNIVDDTHAYKSGYAFLVDTQANVMYHKNLPINTSFIDIDDKLRPLANELRKTGGGTELFPYTWQKKSKKLAFCSLQNGMRFVVTAPTSEIDEEKNLLILHSIIAFAIISFLSVILTTFITRRLVRPLKELNDAADKIAKGDLSISITQKSKDEVGTLAGNFQQTVHHLQESLDYINGLAYRDTLTGVKNKAAYLESVPQLEASICSGKSEFAVLVLNIFNLHKNNRDDNTSLSDKLVIDLCKIISAIYKQSLIYRTDYDEFIVILEHGDYRHFSERSEQFQLEVEKYMNQEQLNNMISIAKGIALYEQETDLTFNNVFDRAYSAMCQNKAFFKTV